ncbi:MAG: hypothetical protein JO139_09765 [Alphaproteobacteria bacterium]|nr:hypothetical protein [Alphaproteobacteria bacterium]MBV8333879.1 hypothetical protein [Alphaproteobacteria bacterium]
MLTGTKLDLFAPSMDAPSAVVFTIGTKPVFAAPLPGFDPIGVKND